MLSTCDMILVNKDIEERDAVLVIASLCLFLGGKDDKRRDNGSYLCRSRNLSH